MANVPLSLHKKQTLCDWFKVKSATQHLSESDLFFYIQSTSKIEMKNSRKGHTFDGYTRTTGNLTGNLFLMRTLCHFSYKRWCRLPHFRWSRPPSQTSHLPCKHYPFKSVMCISATKIAVFAFLCNAVVLTTASPFRT